MTNTTIDIARPEMLQDGDVWGCFRLAVDQEGARSNGDLARVAAAALRVESLPARWRAAWAKLGQAVR